MCRIRVRYASVLLLAAGMLFGAEHRGVVKLGTVPVPGAVVTAQRGGKSVTALTDGQGGYFFADLAEGQWTVKVEMSGFAPLERTIQVPGAADWSMTILPLAKITSSAAPAEVRAAESPKAEPKRAPKYAPPAPVNTKSGFQSTEVKASGAPVKAAEVTEEVARKADDGFLVNGSVNNAAASAFSQLPAFGNNRGPKSWPYHGNFGFQLDNSALDARPFSLTGQNSARPGYNRFTGFVTLGGPVWIPGLVKKSKGPQFTLNYQWTRNRTAAVQSALVPSVAERAGDLSQTLNPLGQPVRVLDPGAGAPIPGNRIPASRISPQALALLSLYPLPNFNGQARYNLQVPISSSFHQDALQFRMVKQLGRKDNLSGTMQWQSIRTDSPNLFGFLATGDQFNINPTVAWRHTFSSRFFVTLGYQLSRDTSGNAPFFARRRNVSGDSGITGNNQDPLNWGPPSLNFANGIAGLGEAQYSSNRLGDQSPNAQVFFSRGGHSLTYGADFHWRQWNWLSQQDGRGTFTFTGSAAGSDFAGFLFGVPDAASIAFGNADKYFRAHAWDAYVSDEWRLRAGLSLTLGARYEFNSPVGEKYGRLVNLGVTGGFAAAAPLIERSAGQPVHADRNNVAPRLGFAWRPFAASTMIVRGGYGVYYDNSPYLNIANQMAQQAPLSTSLRVQNSPSNPLTLANGFRGAANALGATFGIDPNFRTGYAQNWQVSVQRDLPYALQIVGTYLGIKGTRATQQFLPNTYPAGAPIPCAACPAGYSYMTSNGNTSRESGAIQLRRRLRKGLAADLQYTWSKALDNAATGGVGFLTAQNWLDLSAERGRSNFDQRHAAAFMTQYTSGSGANGFFNNGRIGMLLREWTAVSAIEFGTGMPLTPTYFSVVGGTGVAGPIRANYTGADPYRAPPGLFLNPAAFAPPSPGQWGNAGRNSLTGPARFTWNGSASRTFRWGDRLSADLRIDAANVLNHPVFPSWNTVITSAQFGLPNPAGPMRTVQTSLRVRF